MSLTKEQMLKLLDNECERYDLCNGDGKGNGACPLNRWDECDFDEMTEKEVEEAYNEMFGIATEDIINHPSHYCREGGMECLDEMELIFGKEALKHFCLCNAWKYRYRASAKNGDEDLKKSDFYMKKYKELSANG